jgi:LexA DNA binding domain
MWRFVVGRTMFRIGGFRIGMAVAPHTPPVAIARPAMPTRKQQALAAIIAHIRRTGHSPSIGEIAAALGVGLTRAKALVHQLAVDKSIERAAGAQRATSVPGLFEQLVLEKLRADGWVVDRDALDPCPKGQLPLVAVLEHIPDPD